MGFKGPKMLSKLNKDYNKQKDNPEYGDRAGLFEFEMFEENEYNYYYHYHYFY